MISIGAHDASILSHERDLFNAFQMFKVTNISHPPVTDWWAPNSQASQPVCSRRSGPRGAHELFCASDKRSNLSVHMILFSLGLFKLIVLFSTVT